MLYQLSYPGIADRWSGAGLLVTLLQPVQPAFGLLLGGRAGEAVAVAEPLEQVAVAAALAAERCVCGRTRGAA